MSLGLSAWGQDDSVIFQELDSDEVYTTQRDDWSESVYEWNGNPCWIFHDKVKSRVIYCWIIGAGQGDVPRYT